MIEGYGRVGEPTSIERGVSPVLIRDVTPGDLDRLLAINEANVPEVGPADRDHLGYLIDESAIRLALETEQEVAGFCLVLGPGSTYDSVNYTYFMGRYDDALYLDRVAFDHRFQGRGFGQALYAAVYERMVRDHTEAARLTLEVNLDPPNEPSLRFHERQGFVEVGRQLSKGIEVSLQSRDITSGV